MLPLDFSAVQRDGEEPRPRTLSKFNQILTMVRTRLHHIASGGCGVASVCKEVVEAVITEGISVVPDTQDWLE